MAKTYYSGNPDRQEFSRKKKEEKVPPATPEDAKLSKKHLHATRKLNRKHRLDHEAAEKRATDPKSKRFNRAHAKDHEAAEEKAEKMLKSGTYFRAAKAQQ